jgi:hypothetical protein
LITATTHLHIPTIFFETYRWLEAVKGIGSTVDIETFYILKAIKLANKDIKKIDCGIFVSDYVGQQPLRDYSHVYDSYEFTLKEFLSQVV